MKLTRHFLQLYLLLLLLFPLSLVSHSCSTSSSTSSNKIGNIIRVEGGVPPPDYSENGDTVVTTSSCRGSTEETCLEDRVHSGIDEEKESSRSDKVNGNSHAKAIDKANGSMAKPRANAVLVAGSGRGGTSVVGSWLEAKENQVLYFFEPCAVSFSGSLSRMPEDRIMERCAFYLEQMFNRSENALSPDVFVNQARNALFAISKGAKPWGNSSAIWEHPVVSKLKLEEEEEEEDEEDEGKKKKKSLNTVSGKSKEETEGRVAGGSHVENDNGHSRYRYEDPRMALAKEIRMFPQFWIRRRKLQRTYMREKEKEKEKEKETGRKQPSMGENKSVFGKIYFGSDEPSLLDGTFRLIVVLRNPIDSFASRLDAWNDLAGKDSFKEINPRPFNAAKRSGFPFTQNPRSLCWEHLKWREFKMDVERCLHRTTTTTTTTEENDEHCEPFEIKEAENIKFIEYDDIKSRPMELVQEVYDFVGLELDSELFSSIQGNVTGSCARKDETYSTCRDVSRLKLKPPARISEVPYADVDHCQEVARDYFPESL